MLQRILVTAAVLLRLATGLDNGLALTPPMGWLTWQRFRCNTDCLNRPDTCISERLIKTMADLMVKEGYKDAGYEYIMIDDCWLAKNRTKLGKLQPDPDRFPSGIRALADYVHNLGLKFGIYEDFGTHTCAGYPGSEFYLQLDAMTFAEWEVDYVKFDGCYSDRRDFDAGYEAFGFFLNKTGRPMVYSCEWPFYQSVSGIKPNYTAIQQTCNLWRNHMDIQDTWDSVQSVIKYYGTDDGNFSSYAKPGAWNDPDMLTIGNFGLSYEESKVQMAMWAIWASPLIMSTDLRSISPEAKFLLQNKHLIAINQDPLGIQGKRIAFIKGTAIEVWSKPLSNPSGSFALAFVQLPNPGDPTLFSVRTGDVGLVSPNGYTISDGFTGEEEVTTKSPDDVLKLLVNPNGVILFVATPVQP
ncbi:alpha-N-acetylgalactosaminidase-like [Mercenaria mercenaria]|uniref:alpha-N-acetylgalactosaminidase-like n=1 Tax=Mercenaria mercenaria TaxID=6596 RepID=UPI00234FA85D|nr:alpha-N-acetylgalactosaminidase-like [Mercenaria mercenaria]